MPDRPPPPDQAARDRIERDLDATLFVEAGAGSGKTTALVRRVLALVTSGAEELRAIAAVTFTEKAATELRDRIREELERRAAAEPGTEVAARCDAALDQLDSAAIGTLHSFAQRLLSEHPVEAGLPPRVEVLDEVASGVEFDRRWTAFRDELLADPALERTLLLLFATGVRPEGLRALAETFNRNWDLVDERVATSAPDPPKVHDALAPALAILDDLCAERHTCPDEDDKLLARLCDLAEHADRIRALDDEYDLLAVLRGQTDPKPPTFKLGGVGSGKNWADKEAIKRQGLEAEAALNEVADQVASACAHRLAVEMRRFTLEAAAARRVAGELEFDDLLVLTRALLGDPEHGARVRRRLHERYRRLLLDEFQDTDPIQIELAVRIAAADPESDAAGSAPWRDVPVRPGHLFVVGDPKQSIYRFRRADISTFLAARDRFGPEGGGVVELTANFRTAEPVIGWVNHVFARLLGEPPETELPLPSQPDYVGLDPTRGAPPIGPPVAVIGRDAQAPKTKADDLRSIEASDVARAVVTALTEGWSVDDGDGGWRAPRLGDITILVPARTSLPFLEDALDEAGIPYRAESSSLVYATRAVRDLLMTLRAISDPTDHLAVVSALRSPLFGCGDDDLFRFKVERGGRWSYLREQPESVPADDPVAAGLRWFAEVHGERHWRSPSELLDRIAADRRALELGFAEGRPRDVWRRVRWVVDQARAWSESTGGGLRDYLHWVAQQTAEGARVVEAVLPETDDDAVRIMTIHAAKGLEFPITIVSGMTSRPTNRPASADVAFLPDGSVGYAFGARVVTPEFASWAPIDEQMDFHERIRLLYVATTRARDHLVVSLHRSKRSASASGSKRTNAELLVDGMGEWLDPHTNEVADVAPPTAGATVPAPAVPEPPVPFEQWAAERERALAEAGRPTTVAATALSEEGTPDVDDDPTAGLRKRPRDLDLPPWLKGRYGSAVGRAVHGVLQTVSLATGEGVEAAVAAQCEAEAIPERAGDVHRLVADALASGVVREAAASPHWRELYVCVPEADRLLEGYLDLVYRGPGGLVVADYKTAATTDAGELDRRVGLYRLQGAAYALALAAATGEEVARVVFLFLTPGRAVERELTDLDAAVEEVRDALRSHRAVALG